MLTNCSSITLFFIIAFLASGFVFGLHKHAITTHHLLTEIYENSRKYLPLLILLCLLGGVLNGIEKYLIVQMRPITCIAEIRFAWIDVAAYMGRSPVHAVISFMGNTLSSLLFPLIAILNISYLSPNITGKRCTIGQYLVVLSLALIYAGSFASRNLAFALMAISFASALLFLYANPCKIQFKKTLLSSLTILALGLGFVLSLSYDRINCGYERSYDDNGSVQEKLNKAYLEGYKDEIPMTLPNDNTSPVLKLVGLYLSHGLANHTMVFGANKIGKNYVLGFAYSKLKWLLPLKSVEVSKYFRGGITMVGAVKHDFNFFGIVVFAALLALILKLILLASNAVRHSVRTFAFVMLFLYLYSITASLMFFPVMTMPFSIMCFGFLFFWIFTIWIDAR